MYCIVHYSIIYFRFHSGGSIFHVRNNFFRPCQNDDVLFTTLIWHHQNTDGGGGIFVHAQMDDLQKMNLLHSNKTLEFWSLVKYSIPL